LRQRNSQNCGSNSEFDRKRGSAAVPLRYRVMLAKTDVAASRLNNNGATMQAHNTVLGRDAAIAKHNVDTRLAADAVHALIKRERDALMNTVEHFKDRLCS